MTLLLPVAASLCPAVPRPVLPYPVISMEHFWEEISQQGDRRETHTHAAEKQRGGGYLDNDNFNVVSHKHALIRAEGWCSCCGIQIKTKRGRDTETGGWMTHSVCSGQLVSSPKSSTVALTTTYTATAATSSASVHPLLRKVTHFLIQTQIILLSISFA